MYPITELLLQYNIVTTDVTVTHHHADIVITYGDTKQAYCQYTALQLYCYGSI